MVGCAYNSGSGDEGYCYCDEDNGWYQILKLDDPALQNLAQTNMKPAAGRAGCIEAALKPGKQPGDQCWSNDATTVDYTYPDSAAL